MSISSSLNAGVSGLAVNASKLASISDNIANSGTFGYKRADVDFFSIALTQREGSYTAGGVRSVSYRQVDGQGTLVSTTNPTDLSVAGRGLLPVTVESALESDDQSLPLQFITTGSFQPDEDGYLKTNAGLVLLAWPADPDGTVPVQARDGAAGLEPVQIQRNQFASEPTTQISVGANLPAEATRSTATPSAPQIPIEYFDNVGASQTLILNFTPTIPATGQSNTWSLDITDSGSGGASIGTYDIVFDSTLGSGGNIQSITPTGAGTYNATTGAVTVTRAGGDMEIFLGSPGSSAYLTQLSAEFAPINVTKNGAPVGNLTGVEVDPSGNIIASYTTGFSRRIYQIPLADVPNLNGLGSEDNQAFTVAAESGAFYLWDAGDGPTGEVIGYAREESTADIAAELTQLIQTQRAYSSNARVIQTVDEMLQETTNIIR